MIVKKPGLLLATCSCLRSLPLCTSESSTSSPPNRRTCTRPRSSPTSSAQSYATIAGSGENGANESSRSRETEHVWPQPPTGQSQPTPYQIFALKQGAPYSKARFYELVKIYHPDLNSNSNASIPEAVRVERYRLIVTAHAILSDPTKRSAYDRFGAGWNGRAEVGGWQRNSGKDAPGPFTHSWNNPSDPIWQNATWEDWERFYARRAQENGNAEYPPKHAPVYMANSYFLALIVGLAIAGSSINYGRAQDAGTYFVEQRDLVHDKTAKDLRKVKQEVSALSSKDDRIEFFLRQREATLGLADNYEAFREERANRLLASKEVCRSEETKERDT